MNETGRSRAAIRMGPLSVAVVMTGGTIAKSYHPGESRLYNFEPKVKEIIDGLRLDDLRFTYVDLMQNDSLDIHDDDRKRITRAVTTASRNHDGVLVTHGTDSMRASGDALCAQIAQIQNPVILTGAMVPYSVIGSDAVQNVTEALQALRFLPSGIYIAFHNRILTLPSICKDYDVLTFREA